MSRPILNRPPSSPQIPSASRRRQNRVLSTSRPAPTAVHRRASISNLITTPALKAQRTSKTSQKLVLLPSAPQTKPFPTEQDDVHADLGYETDAGVSVREYKSEAERMTKEQRKRAGFKRITAYCVAEEFRMKLLASFLKREHNVLPRVFDEALYVMYHLPLLPGYGPHVNIRSSVPQETPEGHTMLSRLSEAEENGYQGTYFTAPSIRSPSSLQDGYITSSSPVETRQPLREQVVAESDAEGETPHDIGHRDDVHESEADQDIEADVGGGASQGTPRGPKDPGRSTAEEEAIGEVVFFAYGVVVFFGLDEGQEKGILEDVETAGIMKRKIVEDDWEVEECHFTHDPNIAYPRIYNDFFTFKSRSHLLKLSVSHALAQSTLLAHYETTAARTLSDPRTLSIPTQLATSGSLNMKRGDALRLTGRLFKLRRDVNLVSNVLDVPELFWSEASLGGLYGAVREYMEIGGRVQVLNEKLGTTSDFLDAIHDHLNNSAMERITWIVIWLIVVAILVELGEVIARLIVHATMGGEKVTRVISREDALRTLERMMVQQK